MSREASQTEHDRIWLEPQGASDRSWCQDNVWGDEAIEYVRATSSSLSVEAGEEHACPSCGGTGHYGDAARRAIDGLIASTASSEPVDEAARIGDAVLAWMVKYDLLDAGNEYRAEEVVDVLNDLAPYDASDDVEQLRIENSTLRKALKKIATRADDNLPMYTPGAMVHTAEEALGDGKDGGQEVEAVAWNERENAFTDFWEQCPKLVDASDVGKARQAFMAGMDAASFFDSIAIKTTTGLVERLRKRADEDQACADNSKVIVDALSEQMRLFESREGHNVYAVRMAVDHKSGMDRDNRYASDLREAASRISQQDAELERLRRELADVRDNLAEAEKDTHYWRVEYDKARKAAFIEAAEIAEETAQGSDHLLKAASHAKDIQGALVHGEGVMTARIIATALRRKAEETRT